MYFRILGARRDTGEPVSRLVESFSREVAESDANLDGILVTEVHPITQAQIDAACGTWAHDVAADTVGRSRRGYWVAVGVLAALAVVLEIVTAWAIDQAARLAPFGLPPDVNPEWARRAANGCWSAAAVVWLAGRLHALEHAIKFWRSPKP